MKTLERYEEICMNYFNGNLEDFKQDLKRLTKREILSLSFHLAANLRGNPKHGGPNFYEANNIIHKYL